MSEAISKFLYYLQYPFVRYAIIVGILISLCSSLLGVTLVLKRYSFIGDGLSHVAFGAMAIAAVMRLTNDMPLVLTVTVLSAIFLLQKGQSAKINGDASIGMISVSALAIGYMLMNLFPSSASANISADVCTTLFGSTSILTLSREDVVLCVVLSIAVLIVFFLFYNKIFAVTFDENFAKATGVKTGAYNLMIAALIAVIIVLAMNLVGSLLISALVIFPAISAMQLHKSFLSVTIASALISVICATVGMIVSILSGTPIGSTIVVADLIAFVIYTILSRMLKLRHA